MNLEDIPPPPRQSKLRLIREFLRLNGTQQDIDTPMFLDGLVQKVCASLPRDTRYGEALSSGLSALKTAYETRRHIWQEEYEHHVDQEFTEDELEAIVTFLESSAGSHFVWGIRRMDVHVRTNTEPFVDEIVAEASASVSRSAT